MVSSTTRPGVSVSPVILAQSAALRAVRHLRDVGYMPYAPTVARDRDALQAALGAALALQVDVQDALRALNALEPGPEPTEADNRGLDGNR